MAIDGGLGSLLRQHLPQVHWQRIETGETGGGVPDLNGCHAGREFWLELKQTSGWAVRIRSTQVAWIERRVRHGGRVLLVTRRRAIAGPRRAAADELWIHGPDQVRTVSELGLRGANPLAMGTGGPAAWPWELVLSLATQIDVAPVGARSEGDGRASR